MVVVRVLLQGQGKGCGARQSRGQDTQAPLPAPTGLHIFLSPGRQSSEELRGGKTCPSSQGGRRARGANLPKFLSSEM